MANPTKRRWWQFRLRDLVWLTVVIALMLGWSIDRRSLMAKMAAIIAKSEAEVSAQLEHFREERRKYRQKYRRWYDIERGMRIDAIEHQQRQRPRLERVP